MMTKKDVYRVWAPVGKTWVDWVRPVPFVELNGQIERFNPSNPVLPCLVKFELKNDTAVIVDLPGARSVEVGILLAQKGLRPIPIYNGTLEQKGSRATSDNDSIFGALIWGASILSEIDIKDNACPVFLTDSNRLMRRKSSESIFDNSWDVYHQDLPTEEYFLSHGIKNILIIGDTFAKDLKNIFFKEYPKKKLSFYFTDGYDEPKLIKKGR
jgi:hypothetical protein